MTVIPNLIILSLPLSFSRKKGCHQNNIVNQHSKTELFSSTQDLRCKIELVIFTFHAVINHHDNGSKMDLYPPITAPSRKFSHSSKYITFFPELYRAMIDGCIKCLLIALGASQKQKIYGYLKFCQHQVKDDFFLLQRNQNAVQYSYKI